jgi:hypothetical protein
MQDIAGARASAGVNGRLHAPVMPVPAPRLRRLLARYPLAAPLLATQLLLIAVTVPWYSSYGLHIAWSTAWPLAAAYAVLLASWSYFRRYASHPTKHAVPDVILATLLLLLLTNIVSPAQYLAVALKRPLVDGWLAMADASLGVNVATLAGWTAGHPIVSLLLTACYASLLPQFMAPLLLVGLRFRDRERLWEYIFHFHFCLIATLAALAIFPAECAFIHYGFESTIDQTRFTAQFLALRNGTFHVIRFNEVEGLISMPSFHVAGALIVTWAFRDRRPWFMTLAALNVGLVSATFMSGAHYFADVVASVLLFMGSVIVYRRVIACHGARSAEAAPAPALAA